MTFEQRKSHLIQLGLFLNQFRREGLQKQDNLPHNDLLFNRMNEQIEMAVHHNGWFTKENVLFSLEEWAKALTIENLDKWLQAYNFEAIASKTVAIIMAGNIPLVGFHDFISVIISGHNVDCKTVF